MLGEATVPSYVTALLIAGAFVASFSTAVALIIFCGTVAVTHIYSPIKKLLLKEGKLTDREQMMVSRLAVVCTRVISVLLTWFPRYFKN
ncbi:hypothetical protein DRO26_00675 [Candidatus Bathyarchaeota archaeon]|nr:MAG: hypothetical protein DRO26_00675 [Candidatus Bathyarchaeota archaeon]